MRLCDALERELGTAAPPPATRPRSISDVVEALGGTSAAAQRLSGAEARRGTEYRSARRRLERYLQGSRHPSPDYLRRLRRLAKDATVQQRKKDPRTQLRERGSGVRMRADIQISNDRRTRTVGRSIPLRITPETWRGTLSALSTGNCDRAEQRFSLGLGAANFAGEVPVIRDVEFLEIL
jgi:hypothetical protein